VGLRVDCESQGGGAQGELARQPGLIQAQLQGTAHGERDAARGGGGCGRICERWKQKQVEAEEETKPCMQVHADALCDGRLGGREALGSCAL